MEKVVFVFGSNTAGMHLGGAAAAAKEDWGAIEGQAEGRQGQSYAIPTLSFSSIVKGRGPISRVGRPAQRVSVPVRLSLPDLEIHIHRFLLYAADHEDIPFLVTRIGCGIAGFADEDVAPLFREASDNVSLPSLWNEIIEAL